MFFSRGGRGGWGGGAAVRIMFRMLQRFLGSVSVQCRWWRRCILWQTGDAITEYTKFVYPTRSRTDGATLFYLCTVKLNIFKKKFLKKGSLTGVGGDHLATKRDVLKQPNFVAHFEVAIAGKSIAEEREWVYLEIQWREDKKPCQRLAA